MSSSDRKSSSKAEENDGQRHGSQHSKSPSPPASGSAAVGVATIRDGDERLLAQIGYQQVMEHLYENYQQLSPNFTYRSCAANSQNGLSCRMRLPFWVSSAPSPRC